MFEPASNPTGYWVVRVSKSASLLDSDLRSFHAYAKIESTTYRIRIEFEGKSTATTKVLSTIIICPREIINMDIQSVSTLLFLPTVFFNTLTANYRTMYRPIKQLVPRGVRPALASGPSSAEVKVGEIFRWQQSSRHCSPAH